MPTNQSIDFKNPSLIVHCLDTVLEKEKYKNCPVVPEKFPVKTLHKGVATLSLDVT